MKNELLINLFKFVQTTNNLLKDGLQLEDFPVETQERIKALLSPIAALHDEVKSISDTLEALSVRLEAIEKNLKTSKKNKE